MITNRQLARICPNCQRFKHESDAVFCIKCGTKLENEELRDFYLSLGVPENKVTWEQNRKNTFSGCPFFLRKIDNTSCLQKIILIDEFPKGHQLSGTLPSASPEAEKIELTRERIHELLNQGFEWYHESEMDTLW